MKKLTEKGEWREDGCQMGTTTIEPHADYNIYWDEWVILTLSTDLTILAREMPISGATKVQAAILQGFYQVLRSKTLGSEMDGRFLVPRSLVEAFMGTLRNGFSK